MKVVIGGSKGGWWGRYVVHGTKNKPRDRKKIELLAGNIDMGERVTAQGKWTENEYIIVLGFKGKPPRRVVRKALKMFEKEFMAGFSKDEYHLDAVAHYDTDDTHIHIRIPKMNLLTGTQLQLYYHKKDVNRVNAIRDYINIKLDLDVSVDEKPLIAENADIQRIQAWREQQNRKPFDFSKKETRNEATEFISDKIRREHQAGNINDLADLKDLFSEHFILELGKPGHDVNKGHYFRIIVDGKTHRLFGEFYSADFWEKEREQREKQFLENVQTPKTDTLLPEAEALKYLEKHRGKRIEEITKKYAKARGKARQARGREEARARKYADKKESNELSRREDQAVGIRETRGGRSPRLERAVNTARGADSTIINIGEIIGSISGTDYRSITERRRSNNHRRSIAKGFIEVLARSADSIKKYIVERVENGRISDLGERINSIRTNVQSGIRERYSELQAGIREFITNSPGSLVGSEENTINAVSERTDRTADSVQNRAKELVRDSFSVDRSRSRETDSYDTAEDRHRDNSVQDRAREVFQKSFGVSRQRDTKTTQTYSKGVGRRLKTVSSQIKELTVREQLFRETESFAGQLEEGVSEATDWLSALGRKIGYIGEKLVEPDDNSIEYKDQLIAEQKAINAKSFGKLPQLDGKEVKSVPRENEEEDQNPKIQSILDDDVAPGEFVTETFKPS